MDRLSKYLFQGVKTLSLHSFVIKCINRLLCILMMILLLYSTNISAQAPAIEWQKNYGGSGEESRSAIIQTTDGGYLFLTNTSSDDYDVGGSQLFDCWVVKLNATGAIEWKTIVGGSLNEGGNSLKETSDGYVFCGTTYSSDGDFTGNHGFPDAFVFKLDKSGNLLWSRTYGSSGFDGGYDIEATLDGGYVFTGFAELNDGDVSGVQAALAAWVVKLDVNGNIQWQKAIGEIYVFWGYAIKQAPDGGYIVTGEADDPDDEDVLVAKLDAGGNLEWMKTFGGDRSDGNDGAANITVTTAGDYVIAAGISGGGGHISNYFGATDLWVFKLNQQGDLLWERTYGGSGYEGSGSIRQTCDGGFILGGFTQSNDGHITENKGVADGWILKLDAEGYLQWQKTLGGSQRDNTHSVVETSDGGFIVAGHAASSDGDATANYGLSDVWVVKLACTPPNTPVAITGNIAPCEGATVNYSIAPVPCAQGYTWSVPGDWTIVSGQGTNEITLLAGNDPGQVSVVAYNSCRPSPPLAVNVSPVPTQAPAITISSSLNGSICAGTRVTFNAVVTGTVVPVYQWKKNGMNVGQNLPQYEDDDLLDNDIITCEISGTTGCGTYSNVSDPIVITVSPPLTPTVSITGSAATICQGEEVVFTATPANGGSSPVYTWYINNIHVGANAAVFRTTTLADGDIVSCMLTSSEGCVTSPNATSNQLPVAVNTGVQASVDITASKTTICENDEVTFTAQAVNGGTSPSYQWMINSVAAGNNTPVFVTNNLSNGDEVYCIVTPGANTCAANNASSATIPITINALPQIVIFPEDTLVTPGAQVKFQTYLSGAINSFEWAPASMLVSPSLMEPTTVPVINETIFRFTAISVDGCPVYKEVKITPATFLYIPSAFTPNGDGLNDVFRIPVGSNLKLVDFSIFNRWGERIFITKDAAKGWDGRAKGRMQEAGVYIYSIKGTQDGKPVTIKGTVTLVR